MSAAEIETLIGSMPGLHWLDVTGGEPFLRRDFEEVVAGILRAAPRLHMLHFPTNGWFTERTVNLCRRIAERWPKVSLVVTVSLDGPSAVHDRMRGRQGSFERAFQTFQALRDLPGIEVYVGTTLSEANVSHIDALGDELRRRLPDFADTEWHWNWLQVSEHFFANEELAEEVDRLREHRGLLRRQLRRRGTPKSLVDLMELLFLINLDGVHRGEELGVPCQALRSAAFVSPEGQLYPCHVWNKPLGDVRNGIEVLWQSTEVHRAREQALALQCGGCFTPCEAYPALAGAPVETLKQTTRRSLHILQGGR